MKNKMTRGYSLIELIIAIGLFALVMTLASGAYLLMIGLNRQAQGIATGINNLSFALETMTRDIRIGTTYNCASGLGDCNAGVDFTFTPSAGGASVTYAHGTQQGVNGPVGDITRNGVVLTDPSVDVTSLMFYVSGTKPASAGEYTQPHVTIIISGTVSSPGKASQYFNVETGATMRGTDL